MAPGGRLQSSSRSITRALQQEPDDNQQEGGNADPGGDESAMISGTRVKLLLVSPDRGYGSAAAEKVAQHAQREDRKQEIADHVQSRAPSAWP